MTGPSQPIQNQTPGLMVGTVYAKPNKNKGYGGGGYGYRVGSEAPE